jgi:hypothetical protein
MERLDRRHAGGEVVAFYAVRVFGSVHGCGRARRKGSTGLHGTGEAATMPPGVDGITGVDGMTGVDGIIDAEIMR